MAKEKVRVRFAPSPTGFLHLGGIRSALFNWLFARKHGGTFVLRIEDTDQARLVPEAVNHLKASLDWLGLTPDETHTQSERLDIYQKYAGELVKKGALYPCWCSPERLDGLRQEAQKAHTAFKYDRHCLKNPGDPHEPHVLRFKVPDKPELVSWDDAVRGHLEVATAELDDFVALKSDGFPTYHLANVVDDHLMEISHVLRADEWLPSTPKHLLLFEAFGWPPPVYAHLPAVTGKGGGKKLSKRDGAETALEYRDKGYLQEALINFMALLGWNPGEGSTKEIFSPQELIEAFDLAHVHKSPAAFDIERLNWLNGVWIRSLPLTQLMQHCQDFWPKEAKDAKDDYREQVLSLVQERLKYLSELPELTDFFFAEPRFDAGLLPKKVEPSAAKQYLVATTEAIENNPFSHDGLEKTLRGLAEQLNAKTGDLFGTLRLAITGRTAAPGLFETMSVLGKEATIRRLQAAASVLQV